MWKMGKKKDTCMKELEIKILLCLKLLYKISTAFFVFHIPLTLVFYQGKGSPAIRLVTGWWTVK